MDRNVIIIDYLIEPLKGIKEIQAVNDVENPILNAEWGLYEHQLNNQFVVSTDEYGISRYEKMLKIKVSDTDTLETRIFNVLTKYQEEGPFTWKKLQMILDSMLGVGNYTLERDVANKILNVKLQLTISRQYEILSEFLERVTPQNMILNIQLRYNTWEQIKPFTWGELLSKTWGEVKEGIL